MTSRRDFIKLMSAVIGGATLSACSRVPGVPDPPDLDDVLELPGAYNFYAVKRSGDALPGPGGGTISTLQLDAAINDLGNVIYGAINTNADQGKPGPGLYQLTFDFDQKPPQPPQPPEPPVLKLERRIAQQGDLLTDGKVITNLGSYDTNSQGHIVFIAETSDLNADPGLQDFRHTQVYHDKNDGRRPEAVLEAFDFVGGNQQRLDRYTDVGLDDEGNLMAVAHYAYPTDSGGDFSKRDQGAFYGPLGAPGYKDLFQLVVSSGQLVPDTHDVVIQGLGLVDVVRGNYVIQARGGQANTIPSAGQPATMLLQGHVAQGEPRLLTASPALGPAALELAQDQNPGETIYGPRIAFNNSLTRKVLVGNVLHQADALSAAQTPTPYNRMILNYNGQPLKAAEFTLPQQSSSLQSLSAPDLAPSGLLYYVRIYGDSSAKNELVVTNGPQEAVLLSTGDTIADLNGQNGKRVGSIMFGHTASHVDSAHRIAFTVVFTDQNADGRPTAAVVVGVPVR